MAKKQIVLDKDSEASQMFKTVEKMASVCGIGVNKLRDMINNYEIEHVVIGNRKLLTERAVWDWYERNKVKVRGGGERVGDFREAG